MCAIILEMLEIMCVINLERTKSFSPPSFRFAKKKYISRIWKSVTCNLTIILVMVEIMCAIKLEIGEIMCAIDLEMNEIMCAINFEMDEIIFHHHHVNVQSQHLNGRIRKMWRLHLNKFCDDVIVRLSLTKPSDFFRT